MITRGGGRRTRDARMLAGRYRVGALLATGGMGEVWAAEDLVLDRPVAVKLLGEALAGDGRAAERLRREARAAARLVHPNIARVLDLGEHDGRPYLVMELLEGESLAARLARAGAMPHAEAAEVVATVADALEAAHQAGVVHRDVKPGNVFLTRAGDVKVLDFGIAWAAGEAALTTGDLLGTAAYLAPERVLGHRATTAADVYALGVLLYELLAGRRPFEADSDIELAMAHVNAHPEPLSRVALSTPPSLAAACHRAMAKDPAARPPSAAAFARLLRPPPGPQPPPNGHPTTTRFPTPTEFPAPAGSQPPLNGHPAPAAVPARAAVPAGAGAPARAGAPVVAPGLWTTAGPQPGDRLRSPTGGPGTLPGGFGAASAEGPGAGPGGGPRTRPRPARGPRTRPLPAGRRRAQQGRRGRRGLRGLVVALLLAGAVLSALPAVESGLSWVGRQVEASGVGQDPGGDGGGSGGVNPGSGGIGVLPEGTAPPAGQGDPSTADPPAELDRRPGDTRADDEDDRDRGHDGDSGGSGRSGGGDSRGDDSSGPG